MLKWLKSVCPFSKDRVHTGKTRRCPFKFCVEKAKDMLSFVKNDKVEKSVCCGGSDMIEMKEEAERKYESRLKSLEVEFDYLVSEKSKNLWKLVTEKDGVQISKMRYSDTNLDAIKAVGSLRCPATKVWSAVMDMQNRPQVDKELTASIKELPSKGFLKGFRLFHIMSKPVMVVSARQFIVVEKSLHRRNDFLSLLTSIDEEDYKWKNSKVRDSAVMGTILFTGMQVTSQDGDPNSSVLTYVCVSDPKGWIPTRVVNYGSVESGLIVAKLRRFLKV